MYTPRNLHSSGAWRRFTVNSPVSCVTRSFSKFTSLTTRRQINTPPRRPRRVNPIDSVETASGFLVVDRIAFCDLPGPAASVNLMRLLAIVSVFPLRPVLFFFPPPFRGQTPRLLRRLRSGTHLYAARAIVFCLTFRFRNFRRTAEQTPSPGPGMLFAPADTSCKRDRAGDSIAERQHEPPKPPGRRAREIAVSRGIVRDGASVSQCAAHARAFNRE